ncbi:MAG: hypothetical protein Ct9H90mP25_1690 [Gammaproteobacteria bacterium]|nr:MAG: hypothetical protein Ct9H90mP25_1690 [Gammaproteobacteria bacterium]
MGTLAFIKIISLGPRLLHHYPSEAHPRLVFERLFGEGGTSLERAELLKSRASLLDSF